MSKRIWLAILVAGLAAAGAMAHGDEKHVMGVVKAVSETHVTVETAANTETTVKITAATKFVKSGVPATWKDLRPGERVVIHAKPIGDTLEATEVRFGASHHAP